MSQVTELVRLVTHMNNTIFQSFYNHKILSEVTNRRRLIIQSSKKIHKANETKRKIMVDIALHRKLRIDGKQELGI